MHTASTSLHKHHGTMSYSTSLTSLFHQRYHVVSEQKYLLGLRGLLTIEAFIWVFLQTFVPAAVNGNNISGPGYQLVLRKTLSVIFWNETLLYSAFIMLSARTICIPFFKDPTKTSIASASFRRGIRLYFPVAVALIIIKLTSSKAGLAEIERFKTFTKNESFETPFSMVNAISCFNSGFMLFWTTFGFAKQAGSKAFPSQTLWIVNVIYQQSYTIFMTMVIIPYTRGRWRVEAFICFIVTAWWVQSWAWFSITGLLFADMVMNMDFKAKSKRGIKIWRSIRCPPWIPAVLLMAAGLTMMFIWAAWKPQDANDELHVHTGIYYTGGLNYQVDVKQPQARVDNYVFLLGFFLLLESSDILQWLLQNRLFYYLGHRSLSKLHPFPFVPLLPAFIHASIIATTKMNGDDRRHLKHVTILEILPNCVLI